MNKILYIFRSTIRDSQNASDGALSACDDSHGYSLDRVEMSHPDSVNDLHPLVDQDVLAFIRSDQDFQEVDILDNNNVKIEIGRY